MRSNRFLLSVGANPFIENIYDSERMTQVSFLVIEIIKKARKVLL